MGLVKVIEKGLEKTSGKILDCADKYLLKIDKETFNPEIPLTTNEQWRDSHIVGGFYSTLGLGITGFGVLFGFCAIKDSLDAAFNFYNSKEMLKEGLGAITYMSLAGISLN
jgi:hypothetical protein